MKLIDRLEKKLATHVANRIEQNYCDVKWLSYHVPKTAGTSFKNTLTNAFGEDKVYGVYNQTNAKEFTKGEKVWIPRNLDVLHGHFKPHQNHLVLFPNAKRIIWLRDPINRAWSLLNHTLDIRNNEKVFEYIKSTFLNQGIFDREEIFLSMIADNQSNYFFTDHYSNLRQISTDFFDFVGKTEEYDSDLQVLGELMNKKLVSSHLNKSKTNNNAPKIPDELKRFFAKDYDVYNKFTTQHRR